jgi:tetratricopeptide (TPR) repeat protein
MMEEGIGNLKDARSLFERAVKQFAPGTDEKKRLWSAYELMEQRAGNINGAQEIYRRAMRESFNTVDVKDETTEISSTVAAKTEENYKEKEIEVSRWADLGSSSMSADEVWMNDGSIEGKVPKAAMQKSKQRRQKQ